MNKLKICAIIAALATSGYAEEYVLQASAKPEAAFWSADGGVTSNATVDLPEGSTLRVLNSRQLQTTSTDYTMPGTVELGCVDDATYGSTTGLVYRGSSGAGMLSANFKWYWGRFYASAENATMTIGGTIDVIGSKNHWFGCSAAPKRITLAANLRSDTADVNVILGHQYSSSLTFEEINASCPMGAMILAGDNSEYQGTFTVYSAQTRRLVVLSGTHPFGSPDVAATKALTVDSSKSIVLALASNCAQSANRKLYFNSTAANYFGAWKDSDYDGFTLSYPITNGTKAAAGNFIKVGDGTFRYNGAYAARQIAISNGTFVAGADATFPSGQAFIVGSGASLVVEPAAAANLVNPSVTFVDETATAEYGVQTIPFDGKTSTPVELTAAQRTFNWVHPFALAQTIALPVYTQKRIAVFTIPNGTMTVADFRDETPKTEGDKPETSLEMETDETTGTQTLYVVVEPVMTMVTVSFDGTNAVPYEAEEDWPNGLVQPFTLSQTFDLPILATNRVAVMKIPGGTHTLDDFQDETPKTVYELPTTWLELGSDDAGNQILYVVAKPALASAGGARWLKDYESGKPTWSDGLVRHAGADYYYIKGYGCVDADPRTTSGTNGGSLDFKGDSFTLADGMTVLDYSGNVTFKSLRTYSGAILDARPASTTSQVLERSIAGDWFVGGGSDSWGTPSELFGKSWVTTIGVKANLSGAGALQLYSVADYVETSLPPAEDPISVLITGNNESFVGQLRLTETGYRRSYLEVQFSDANAFGGARETLADNAVLIDRSNDKVTNRVYRVVVAPQASVTVNAANRGWTASTAFGIRTPADVVFGFAPPKLTLAEEVRKDGEGVLVLGCNEMAVGEDASLTVAAGSVAQSAAGCTADLPVTFAGGGVCVDCAAADAVKATGFAPKSIALAEGVTSVPVTFLNVPTGNEGRPVKFSQTVLTAPAGTAELTLVPEECKGYAVTITSAADADGATVYTANFQRNGLMFILR